MPKLPIFIPLCGLHKAMVIPAKHVPYSDTQAGIQINATGETAYF